MRRFLLVLLTVPWLNLAAAEEPLAPRLELGEIVADPQTDWTGDGRVTPSDEFIELWNPTSLPVDLAGWALWLNDTTPVLVPLSGLVPAAGRWVLLNPPGEINNNAHVALRFPGGVTADEVRYGTWPGDGPRGPDAGSQGATTEALRRVGNVWKKGHATPGSPNDEPWLSRAPPYDAADGWWDPGNATRPWTLEVTDADRAYARLGLRLAHSGIEQVWDGPAVGAGGRWRANGTLITPKEDFESTPLASDTLGGIHAGPVTRVRVDRLPPPVPAIPAPPWVADTTVALSLIPVVDDGIGGVTYRVETASESDGPWTPHANASNPQSLPPLVLEEAGHAWVRARALDAYGHASPWTPPWRVRHDADLPTPMRALAASGVEAPTLNWESPTDPSSGIQWVIVERVEPTPRSWRLPPDARSLTDDGLRPGHAPTYRLWAVDAVGRAGPAIDYRPEWPGLYPHVRQLHASRDWWGPGTLRLRVDFDRPMDPDSDPRIELVADGQRFALLGSWLANRTSYAVRLNDSAAYPAGPARLLVTAATDAHGHALLAPAERALHLDSAPPQLRIAGSAARWINATGTWLDASDDQDAAPEIHWSVAGVQRAGGPRLHLEPANGTLHVRAYARDLAGNRSPWIERTFHVDAAPPTARLQRRTLATADILIVDDGAGLDPNQTRLPPGRWLEPPTGTGRTARYRADVTALRETLQLHLVDRVGNAADARLEILPSTLHPTTRPDRRVETLSPEAADAAPEPSRSFAMPAVDAKDVVPGLAVTGLAGLALALPAARRRTRRRTPSLARRLRTHRRGAPASHP